jgi:gliding motility-associated-like protein
MPYSFNWSNGSTSQDLNNVGSGAYWYVVTDANNCAFSFAYTIDQTAPIKVLLDMHDVSCHGINDGSISTTVTGGTPGFTYQWSNGASQSELSNIGGGTYMLTITDANNCTNTQTITINEPSVLSGSVNSPLTQYGFNESGPAASDGSVTTSINGGTAPYVYSWSNGANTADLTNVPAGSYTLTVTDQHGCKFAESITLTAPLVLEMPSGISPNGDGLNDNFIVHGLELYPSNNLKIFNRWGNSVYEKDNYTQNWAGKSNSGADLPDGTYFVILKINNSDITLTGYVDVRR